MSNLPYKLWLFLPFIFTHYVSGQWTVTPGPSEGAGQTQITLLSIYDRIDIIDPPRDDDGNVVGTFLATDNLQSTTSGNTFYFTANSMISMVMFTLTGMEPMPLNNLIP